MNSMQGAGCSLKQFVRYVVPSVAAMLLFSLYTVIDAIFVAKGAGPEAMTAVNISLPFISTLSGFSVLLSMGTATLVAFARGREDKEEADGLFSQTVAVIVLMSGTVTVLVALFAGELAAFLGAGPLTIDDATTYLRIVSLFSICFILSYCLEVMVKVDDSPYMATVGVAASFVINIGLSYLFVIRFGWGVTGAAWSTGLAQVASLIIFLAYFFSKRAKLKIRRFTPRPRMLLRSFPLGVADCSVEMIIAFLTFLYNHILLAYFGESYQTIYAVMAYVSLFVFMVMQGVAQGMMHLVSFHAGKGESKIGWGYFRMSLLSGLSLGVFFAGLCQLAPEALCGLLLPNGSPLFQQAVAALRVFSLSFLFVGVNISIAGYLTAVEKPAASISLALGRGFLFAPIALGICAFLFGGRFLWFGALLGESACVVVSLLVLRRYRRRDLLGLMARETGAAPAKG